MERTKEKKISELLQVFLKSNKLEEGYAEYKLKKAWEELLGHSVARATRSLYIKDKKLFVKLHSSVIRSELSMIKPDLLKRLNEEAGREVIVDIILK